MRCGRGDLPARSLPRVVGCRTRMRIPSSGRVPYTYAYTLEWSGAVHVCVYGCRTRMRILEMNWGRNVEGNGAKEGLCRPSRASLAIRCHVSNASV